MKENQIYLKLIRNLCIFKYIFLFLFFILSFLLILFLFIYLFHIFETKRCANFFFFFLLTENL